MRPFKHDTGSDSGCKCSIGRILLLFAVMFVGAYGLVIGSMFASRNAESTAKTSSIPPSSSLRKVTSMMDSRPKDPPASFIVAHSDGGNKTHSPGDSHDLDTITAVVECKTTHGPITIDVRERWGPLGAAQYLSLVDQEFFSDLAFFRVAPRYITQFGAKLRENNHATVSTIKDDKSLWGKRDMDFGYLFFAGSGVNSRHDQMVLALCEQAGCIQTALGKAPWEVPIGTVREEDFSTLKSIMHTGFPYPKLEMPSQQAGAGGPNQGKIMSDSSYLTTEYPDMAYWKECRVVRRNVEISSPIRERKKSVEKKDSSGSQSLTGGGTAAAAAAADKTRGVFVRFDIDLVHEDGANSPHSTHFVVEVKPEWAPLGAQRFLELVEAKFFDSSRFFRVLNGFMAQFGIAADPKMSTYWRQKAIPDDPVVVSNQRGYMSFAMAGPNTRTSQLFINFQSNAFLDKQNFAPFARVVEGMSEAVDALYAGYGEGGNGKGTDGKGPNQNMINNRGEEYLQKVFPNLSVIRSVTILPEDYILPTAAS